MSPSARILVWTDDPGRGGVAQYNDALVHSLAADGHDVHLVQTPAETPLVSRQAAAGVHHHWLSYDTSAEFGRGLTDLDTPRKLFSRIEPDLVVFSDGCPLSNLAAREVARTAQIPFVCVVGFVAEYLARQFPTCLPILARHYRAAAAIVAVSRHNLDQLRRHYGLPRGRGQIIHYGRPEPFFAPRDEAVRERLRAQLNLPPGTMLALTTARLTKIKGYLHLLSAIAALKQAGRAANVRYVWLGEGDQRAQLESEIARLGLGDRISLLGHRWDTADWYDAADCYLLPTENEGMPLAIMEAMAKGLPIAASAVSGIPEELAHTGVLLPDPTQRPTDAIRTLAQTIDRWSASPADRQRLGRTAHDRANQCFREARMLRETTALLERHVPSSHLAA
jgi:glycosyltransferase involved in cell wall biosynthesis